VVNYQEMASERELDTSTMEILSMSHTASKSLIYFVDDLLHLTGSRQDPTPPLEESFDIRFGLQHSFGPLRKYAIRKSLEFEVVVDAEFPNFVQGDLQRLQQAVSSLVTNAIQYTTSGGVVIHLSQISTTETDCLLGILVRDTGLGMTDSELDDLFQEFEEVTDEETNDENVLPEPVEVLVQDSGKCLKLGLGLSLVARFVKNRHGQIRITSVHGKSTSVALELPFKLSPVKALHPFQTDLSLHAKAIDSPRGPLQLPVHPKYRAKRSSQQHRRSSSYFSATGRRSSPLVPSVVSSPSEIYILSPIRDIPDPSLQLRVLVADDNSINLQIMQRRLEKMGHSVRLSWDGHECFELFKEHHSVLDFVLMDLDVSIDAVPSLLLLRPSSMLPLIHMNELT
jgi:hypothetical protein